MFSLTFPSTLLKPSELVYMTGSIFKMAENNSNIACMATVLWDSIPANLKELNVFNFSKQLKLYLQSEQQYVTL